MTVYSKDDLVQVEKGEFIIRQRFALSSNGSLYLPDFAGRPSPEWLFENGYSITIIEKAKPKVKLPTGPGTVIRDSDGKLWALWDDGSWESAASWRDASALAKQAEIVAGFTVYSEPRAVTAKAVLDDLAAVIRDSDRRMQNGVELRSRLREFIQNKASMFGVVTS